MTCPILDIEAQQNAKKAESDAAMDKIHMVDTSLNILSVIKKYGENLNDPRFKSEVTSIIEGHQTSTAGDKLKKANDQVYKNTGLQRATKEYKVAMEQHIREQNATGNFQGTMGAITTFLNKQFKSYTVALSLGRFLNESSQAWLLALTNKFSQLSSSPFRKERFASMLGLAEDKLPLPGNISRESFIKREFEWESNIFGGKATEHNDVLDMLDKPAAKLRELGGRMLDMSVGRIEQFFYQTEFYRSMWDYVTKNGKDASSFLWKDNITSQNKLKKEKLMQQWKREARDSTKTAFFDYSANPLIVNKLETFVPFTNFMYNGLKLLNKYPATFLFGATLLNNAQYAYGQSSQYLDDDGQMIDAGQSLRIPILASLGLDQVALNMNRMLQITPGSIGVRPLAVYNFLTGREDPRFKKFYKSGTFQDYADIGLSMVSPPIQKVVNALVNWDKNKDLEGKSQNSLADLNESIAYLTTGVIFKDKTTSAAWQYYIDKDYDTVLGLSNMQKQRFFAQDSMIKKWITEKTIKALKKAKDLGVLNFSDNSYENAIVTLSGLPIHDSLATESILREDGDMVRNLAEVAIGKNFIDKNYENSFESTLSKWKELYADKNFKEFSKAMPVYGASIKHFVENERYYSDRADAFKLRSSQSESDRLNGELKLLALNYRFKGDEGMSLTEKISAMKYGKLDSPMFYGSSKDWIPAHSVMMTPEYLSSLQYKGSQVSNYIEKTNSVSALNQMRTVFYGLAYAANTIADKNKYFDLAKKMYTMSVDAEHELKVSGTPEYALFQLSPDYKKFQENVSKQSGKDYSFNTWWFSTYTKNRTAVITNISNQRDIQQNALVEKLKALTPQEVEFMQNVMKTNTEHRINSFKQMMKDLKDPKQDLSTDKGYLETLFNK